MTDTPIASDLSYEVLQRRRRECELTTPALNEANRRAHADVQQVRQMVRGNVGSFDVGPLLDVELTPIRDRHVR